jgi:hypothetical protein
MSILRFLIQKNRSNAFVPEISLEDQDLPNPSQSENPSEIRTSSPDPVDLRLSTLKPLHSRWMLSSFEKLRANAKVKMIGWEKTGIEEAFNDAYLLE